MNVFAKWQFSNNIHYPSQIPYSISLSALLPYPYPKDIGINLSYNLKPLFSPNFLISEEGSAPFYNINIIGVLLSD